MLDLKKNEHPNIWDNKSPNFGTFTWEKVPFGCSPMKNHCVYYREGSEASFQRL